MVQILKRVENLMSCLASLHLFSSEGAWTKASLAWTIEGVSYSQHSLALRTYLPSALFIEQEVPATSAVLCTLGPV